MVGTVLEDAEVVDEAAEDGEVVVDEEDAIEVV